MAKSSKGSDLINKLEALKGEVDNTLDSIKPEEVEGLPEEKFYEVTNIFHNLMRLVSSKNWELERIRGQAAN